MKTNKLETLKSILLGKNINSEDAIKDKITNAEKQEIDRLTNLKNKLSDNTSELDNLKNKILSKKEEESIFVDIIEHTELEDIDTSISTEELEPNKEEVISNYNMNTSISIEALEYEDNTLINTALTEELLEEIDGYKGYYDKKKGKNYLRYFINKDNTIIVNITGLYSNIDYINNFNSSFNIKYNTDVIVDFNLFNGEIFIDLINNTLVLNNTEYLLENITIEKN